MNIKYLIVFQNQMLMVLLVALLCGVACYFVNKYYWKPKRLISWYKNTLEIMGYNVLVFPYKPFKIMLLQNQKYNEKEYNDAFYDEKYNWKNYDIIISNTSNMITLIFINPRLLKYLFAPQKNYIIIKSHLNKYGFKLALGNTMILNEGPAWKRKRKVLSQVFNFEFIKRNVDKMKQICKEMLDKMQKKSLIVKETSNEIHYEYQLINIFQDIISNIVIRCFFGAQPINSSIEGSSINQYLSEALKDGKKQSTDILVLLFGQNAYHWGLAKPYRELKRKLSLVRKEVKQIINNKKQNLNQTTNLQKYTDIFEAMWLLKSKESKQLSPLDQQEMIEQFCAFMTAGNDSTSLFANMIMYFICENPEVQSRLRKQIQANIPSEQDITFANIRKIEYLEWIQLQTTRMYGPATSIFLREAVKDTSVDNIPILKGTGIKIQLLPNHYNQKYFKNPLKFDPIRWSSCQQFPPFCYGGFGFGARTCLGKHLAYLSTKIIVIMLLKRYKQISIDKKSSIRFQFKGFYSPSPFKSIIVKELKKQ